MKAHEVLLLAKPILEKINNIGINPNDVQYLDMYSDYNRLKGEGHKTTYIEVYLCEQYNVSRAKFYQIVKVFGLEL